MRRRKARLFLVILKNEIWPNNPEEDTHPCDAQESVSQRADTARFRARIACILRISTKRSDDGKKPPRPPFGGRGEFELRRAISRVPSVGSSEKDPTWRSFLWECRCRHPPARHPFRLADREHTELAGAARCMELLALARGGVCPAPFVTERAVRSYRTISTLPATEVTSAVYFLWHYP